MKKKIIASLFFSIIFSLSYLRAIKIGPFDIQHDIAEGYKVYSSWFGEQRKYEIHKGIDIPCPNGTPVKAALDGYVYQWGEKDPVLGNYVILFHEINGQRYYTHYYHLSEIRDIFKQDFSMPVYANQEIGKSGNTGHCYGEHGGYHLDSRIEKYDDYSKSWNLVPPYPWSKNDPKSGLEHEGYKYYKDGGKGGPEGGDGDGSPGGENPDDNESYSNNTIYSISSDPEAIFFRLAPKKVKKYILQLWNLKQLLEERDQYFVSLSSGGIPDEAYLNSLNIKIDDIYNLISTNSLQYDKERSETPDVVVLRHGYFSSASSLIDKSLEPWRRVILTFNPLDVNENPILVIPTGGLHGMENSEQFKAVLRDYVGQGGTLIVFSQQHGYEFSVLPTPDGKPIAAYGWREDQSCQSNSVYVDTWHPALSSATQSLISSPVDGFFADYPSNSTVLLKRRVNAMPAMLAYPYGEGMVVVSSLFEDWGSTHWQSTAQGRAIIRDLIAWIKNIDVAIPEYNLIENPNPEVSLNLEIKNLSDKPASKVKVLWLDPDRSLIFEEDKLVSIPAGKATSIAVSHVFSSIPDQKLGIWHVDYVLYDSEGKESRPQVLHL